MPYDSLTTRTDLNKLLPEDVATEVIVNAIERSAVLAMARRIPNIPRGAFTIPVFSSKPTAYFVTGDTGLKQTSEVAWDNVVLTAEELAVVIPIPENVFNDTSYNLWAAIQPQLEEAFGLAIDAAVLFGTNKPATWPTAIVTAAASASNSVDLSSTVAGGGDLYDAILGESGTYDLVTQDGYMVNGNIAALSMQAKLRGLRDANGNPILNREPAQKFGYSLDGVPTEFPRNGGFDPATALMISGDWSQLVYAFRQDITFKIFDQGVIQDGAGAIALNLMQQDAIAMRAVMRIGFALPNPVNRVNANGSTRYPFSILVP
jgi:HK97 family phage major capsid protein